MSDPETGEPCGILRVSDGTKCNINMKSYLDQESGEGDGAAGNSSSTQILCKEGLVDLDVFIYGEKNLSQVFGPIKADSYILLKGLRCLREDLQVRFC